MGERGTQNLIRQDMEEMLTLADAAATIITTRGGALRVMPEEEESLKQIGKIYDSSNEIRSTLRIKAHKLYDI